MPPIAHASDDEGPSSQDENYRDDVATDEDKCENNGWCKEALDADMCQFGVVGFEKIRYARRARPEDRGPRKLKEGSQVVRSSARKRQLPNDRQPYDAGIAREPIPEATSVGLSKAGPTPLGSPDEKVPDEKSETKKGYGDLQELARSFASDIVQGMDLFALSVSTGTLIPLRIQMDDKMRSFALCTTQTVQPEAQDALPIVGAAVRQIHKIFRNEEILFRHPTLPMNLETSSRSMALVVNIEEETEESTPIFFVWPDTEERDRFYAGIQILRVVRPYNSLIRIQASIRQRLRRTSRVDTGTQTESDWEQLSELRRTMLESGRRAASTSNSRLSPAPIPIGGKDEASPEEEAGIQTQRTFSSLFEMSWNERSSDTSGPGVASESSASHRRRGAMASMESIAEGGIPDEAEYGSPPQQDPIPVWKPRYADASAEAGGSKPIAFSAAPTDSAVAISGANDTSNFATDEEMSGPSSSPRSAWQPYGDDGSVVAATEDDASYVRGFSAMPFDSTDVTSGATGAGTSGDATSAAPRDSAAVTDDNSASTFAAWDETAAGVFVSESTAPSNDGRKVGHSDSGVVYSTHAVPTAISAAMKSSNQVPEKLRTYSTEEPVMEKSVTNVHDHTGSQSTAESYDIGGMRRSSNIYKPTIFTQLRSANEKSVDGSCAEV